MTQDGADAPSDRKAAEKRRLAEALRANLRRRKTARDAGRAPAPTDANDQEDRG